MANIPSRSNSTSFMNKYLCSGGRENPNIYTNQNSNSNNLILSLVLSKKYTSIANSKSLFLGFQIQDFICPSQYIDADSVLWDNGADSHTAERKDC